MTRARLLFFIAVTLAGCGDSCSPNVEVREVEPRREGEAPAPADPGGAAGELDATDPFCGVRLRRSEAAATAVFEGRTYYFCLEDHRDAFMRDPRRFLGGRGDAGPAALDGSSTRPQDGGSPSVSQN